MKIEIEKHLDLIDEKKWKKEYFIKFMHQIGEKRVFKIQDKKDSL